MIPLTLVHETGAPLSLRQTLGSLAQGGTDPTLQRDGADWWMTLRLPEGTASLRLRPVGSAVGAAATAPPAARPSAIEATAWGDGAASALATVPGLLGHHDDADGFEAGRHPLVGELHRRSPGLRLSRTGLVVAALLPAILFQKVTSIEAKSSWRQLLRKHGEPAPGPAPLGMRVIPTVEAWRRIPSWEWHRAGVGPQRSDTIMRALAVASGLERSAVADPVEARRRLRTVPGIGVWTAAETVQRSHGDPDAVSVGDFHICKLIGTALIGRRVDDDGMLELLEPWRGHRQRVVRLIMASGIGYERHGPRMTIPEHRAR